MTMLESKPIHHPVAPPVALQETERAAARAYSTVRPQRWGRIVRLISDCVALISAVILSILTADAAGMSLSPRWAVVVFPLLALASLQVRGLYVSRLRVDALDVLLPTFSAISSAAMLTLVAGEFADGGAHPVMLRLWVFSVVLVAVGRTTTASAERGLRRRGVDTGKTIIVGAGAVAIRIASRLKEHPEYGLTPVGFVDDGPSSIPLEAVGVPLLGSLDDLGAIIDATDAEHVLIAFATVSDRHLVKPVRAAQERRVTIEIVPRLFDAVGERSIVEHIGGMPVLRLPNGLTSRRLTVKHVFDKVLAALALAVLSPLLLLTSVAVRLSSPGPIVFRQRRVGRDGQEFELLKFRSMRLAEASNTPAFGHLSLAVDSAPGGIEGVDRRTAVGKFIRRTSIDELPQLINVLRGEMSLVGPRPERPEFANRFALDFARYGERQRMRAGLTGWAQVHNLRGQTSLEKRIEWDNYYIENWSPWLDLKILVRTAVAVLRDHKSVV